MHVTVCFLIKWYCSISTQCYLLFSPHEYLTQLTSIPVYTITKTRILIYTFITNVDATWSWFVLTLQSNTVSTVAYDVIRAFTIVYRFTEHDTWCGFMSLTVIYCCIWMYNCISRMWIFHGGAASRTTENRVQTICLHLYTCKHYNVLT